MIRRLFGGGGEAPTRTGGILSPEEREQIGTERDPLHGYEAALERNLEAQKAEGHGDAGRAVQLYEMSIAESFVGAHPYERVPLGSTPAPVWTSTPPPNSCATSGACTSRPRLRGSTSWIATFFG